MNRGDVRPPAGLKAVLRSGTLTAWLNSWLAGEVAPEDVDVYVSADDPAHHVVTAPVTAQASADTERLLIALGRWRRAGLVTAHLRVLHPGDAAEPVDPVFDAAAWDAGARVDLVSAGPGFSRTVLTLTPGKPPAWIERQLPDAPPIPTSTPSAVRRALDEALREATLLLSEMDVARAHTELPSVLASAERAVQQLELPPGVSGPAGRLMLTAIRVLTMVDLARESEGGALTAAAAADRHRALDPVARAARRALEASFGPH
jgi:hypothetical protein